MYGWVYGWVCIGAWVYGRMGAWVYGCRPIDTYRPLGLLNVSLTIRLWVYGCMSVWMHECMGVWVHGSMGVWVHVP